MVVVLPAPFGPRKPNVSPGYTERFNPFRATFTPLPTSFERNSIRRFSVFRIGSTTRNIALRTSALQGKFLVVAWRKMPFVSRSGTANCMDMLVAEQQNDGSCGHSVHAMDVERIASQSDV